MIKYTTKRTQGTITVPTTQLINNRYVNVDEKEVAVNVLHVTTREQVSNREQIKDLVTSIYPEIIDVLGTDDQIGLRIDIEKEILRTLVYQGDQLPNIQKAVIRQYVAEIELPTIINRSTKGQTPDGM